MKHFISSLSVINANTPPCEGRVSSRKILSLLLILFLGVGNAWGAEETELFSQTYPGSPTKFTGAYNSSFSLTTNDYTLVYANVNNGQKTDNWTAVRAGSKNNASVATITSGKIEAAISKVMINFTQVVAKSTNSLYLEVSNNSSFTSATKITATIATGNVEFTIATPLANQYYRITIDQAKGSANGFNRFDKIVFYQSTASSGGDEPVATLTATPTTIDFGTVYQGAEVESQTVAVNFENLNGSVTYSGLSTPFTATGAISATGDKITISADASTIGEYSQTLTVASTADSKTAEVTVKMNVVEKPAPTGTFTLHTGALVEGDYVIVSTNSLKAEVNSDRLASLPVTISNDEIVDPDATTIWHIAKSGEYWTLYNANKAKYAASTGAKNKAALLDDATDDKALWSVTGTSTYEFVNKKNTANSVNANLRYNSGNAENSRWACYSISTGAALSLYRKAGTKYNVTVSSTTNGSVTANPTSAEAGTTITLTVTPDAGYVLDALAVTDASSNTIEVADNKFTMPAADVTIAATFKENEKPAATLTLSKNGVTEDITGYKQDDKVILPSITSDCVKAFVGWSADDKCATEPEYKADEKYTLTKTAQTLYAVYATVGGGGETTASVNMATYASAHSWGSTSSDNQKQITINSDVKAVISEGGNSGKYYDDGVRIYQTESATVTISTTVGELKSVKFTFTNNNDGTLLYGSTKLTSGTAVEVSGTSAVFSVSDTHATENKGQIRFTAIEVTYASAPTYSDYSTTCAAAPIATIDPTSVTATAAGAEGKVTVTYENVNTANVSVALFNDAACTETFTADWLTASLDGDKNIAYTVAATTLYTERKAYIQLTAPETTGATEPAVVVIPVTQAGKDKVFASLEELVAAITPTTAGIEVTVTLTNEVIQDFYKSGSYTNGIALNVPYEGGVKVIEIYCKDVPAEWVKGGKVSGTITCPWKLYNSTTWELCPNAWTELTYTAPATVSSIAVSGTPTKTTYIDGEKFDPAGLVVTATYSDATTEVVTTYANWTIDPATLTKGQTSVNVTATYNSISSAAYEVTGLTVNDIPTKTVDEFITAEGGRCYLEGIVSDIANTTYGNFDLTDASGTIYVYGCLNAAGESKKFAELGVKNGDKIKVIADQFKVYGGKDQATDVQYVSHVSAASITIADITMEVNEVKTISATLDPAEAEVTYTIKENTANAISLSGNTITALKEGTATITAVVAEGADYLGTTKDFTVTVTPQNIATLPFEFDGKQADIANILGMSHSGIDESDYNDSPYLKMNTTGDWLIIHFNERPGELTYDIKANTGNAQAFSGTFTVQESADGVTYRNLAVYTTINTTKEPKTHNCFDKDTRYIKFIFTTKGNGNVALGNIKIEKSVVTKVTPTVVANSYFSVGNGEFVQFSTGNLQYEVGTNTWSFASEQYEVIGGEAYDPANPTNTNYGMNVPGYTGKLDLFAWSCDGKFGVNPSNADADYTGGFADWGDLVSEAGWSTLTRAQMEYLLERKKDGKKLWGLATLEGKVALILLPDNWNTAIEFTYGYVPTKWNFTANELTKEDWNNLEANGAVLLPAGGSRAGGYGNEIGFDGETVETDATKLDANGDYFHVDNVGDYGYYWLSSTAGELADYLILPASDNTGANTYSPDVWSREKRRGNSVRLVKAIEPDYTREVRPGYYGTICLENGGQMIGASLFELSYYNETQGLLYMDEAYATMVAGNPYVFLPNERATNKTLYVFYDETTAAAKTVNGLVGYLGDENKQLEGNGTNYILQDNKIKKVVGGNNSNVFVTKNRAYIQLGEVNPNEPAPVPGRRRVAIGQAPQVATGMESVDASAQPVKMIINGQLYILRGEKMYDAQGKLVK